MDLPPEFNVPPGRIRFTGGPPEVRVHVLSEHVFCPRAAILALESGDDAGDEEPQLGPRLDGLYDYDEHRFAEAWRSATNDMVKWCTMMAFGVFFPFVVWRLLSAWAALVVALPTIYLAAEIVITIVTMVHLVRARACFRAAGPLTLEIPPQRICGVNWWSLRKAGFDCLKPEVLRDLDLRLSGRPWRMLTKGTTLRIPVVRRHRGERIWGHQHIVRLAAYCHLIEACEAADAPFGVLMFAGSYDCVVFPNNALAKLNFEAALQDVREFLAIHATGKFAALAPTDNRCSGCHFGKPTEYLGDVRDAVLDGVHLVPLRTDGRKDRHFHCPCGDKFGWTPPHVDAVNLGIAERR
jgi:hypothetical protein